MKKILILLCAFSLLLSLCSCKNQPSDEEIIGCEAPDYRGRDLEEFINEWKAAQQSSENVLYSVDSTDNIAKLTVPQLHMEDYRFASVRVSLSRYMYSYVPIDETNKTIEDVLVIMVSDINNSFQSSVEQLRLEAVDGFAYNKENNTWYINNEGKRISISFPPSIVVEEPSQISDYFTFETYTAGESSGNDHVVS